MHHPAITSFLARERIRDFQEAAATSRRVRREPSPVARDDAEVALRLCRVDDDPALERLAQLEGRPLPRGRFVLAEVDGTVVAALPLAGGKPLADPFRRTEHVLPLLRLRAEQVAPPRRQRYSLRRHWSLIRGSTHA